jgi:hypothetical protein
MASKKERQEELYVDEYRTWPNGGGWIVVAKFPYTRGPGAQAVRDAAFLKAAQLEDQGKKVRVFNRGPRERSHNIGDRHKV